jgi:hypothetical protein
MSCFLVSMIQLRVDLFSGAKLAVDCDRIVPDGFGAPLSAAVRAVEVSLMTRVAEERAEA